MKQYNYITMSTASLYITYLTKTTVMYDEMITLDYFNYSVKLYSSADTGDV